MKNEWWYQQTEKLLYNYPRMQKRLNSLQGQLELVREQLEPPVIPSYSFREGKSNSLTVPLERVVIKRLEGREVREIETEARELQSTVSRIESGLENLNEDQMELVRMRYFEEKQLNYIADELGMDDNTYYRKVKAIVWDIAYSIGLMPKSIAHDYMGIYFDPDSWSKSEG